MSAYYLALAILIVVETTLFEHPLVPSIFGMLSTGTQKVVLYFNWYLINFDNVSLTSVK